MFYIPERTRALVLAWDDLTFEKYKEKLPGKGSQTQLNVLIEAAVEQHALPAHYQDAVCHRNLLLAAVRNEPMLQIVRSKLADSTECVIVTCNPPS